MKGVTPIALRRVSHNRPRLTSSDIVPYGIPIHRILRLRPCYIPSVSLADIPLAVSAAIAGALLGYVVGLEKLRRERAFELKLKWHQSMLEVVHQMAYDLETAVSLQEDDDPEEWRRKAWEYVQIRQRDLVILAASSPLFASREMNVTVARLEADVDTMSTATSGFDWSRIKKHQLADIRELAVRLRHSAKPFARAAREELRIT
jgi:hypothetical protein